MFKQTTKRKGKYDTEENGEENNITFRKKNNWFMNIASLNLEPSQLSIVNEHCT